MKAFYSNTSKFCLFLCSVLIILSSCKENDPNPATSTDLMTNSWKLNMVFINNVQDVSGNYSLVQITFNEDGTYAYSDNGTIEKGTWEFNGTEQQIILDKDTPRKKTLTIQILNETRLEYSYTSSNYKTGSIEVTFKLIRK